MRIAPLLPILLLVALASCGDFSKGEGYNVLLITIDTLRADHVSAYGYRGVETACLDDLAARGARFEHAYAPCPITLPSHVSLMTGTYPTFHGVRDNGIFQVHASAFTLAEALSAQGYRTAAVVAAYVLDACFGLDQGFDEYHDEIPLDASLENPFQIPERNARQVTDQALAFLDRGGEGPFFLWAHYYDPHAPYLPPTYYARRHAQCLYDGEIDFTDDQIGRLMDGLDERGLRDNTLIVVTSDHGESLMDHGEATHGPLVYDTTLHVPLIMTNARLIPEPRVINEKVSLLDVMPTVLDLLPGEDAAPGQGTSLKPLLQGRALGSDRIDYFETLLPYFDFGWAGLRGIRTDRFKYIAGAAPELYDYRNDPREERNLIDTEKQAAQGLEEAFRRLVAEITPQDLGAEQNALDEETRERLAALGYSSGAHATSIEGDPFTGVDPKSRLHIVSDINRASMLVLQDKCDKAVDLLEGVLKEEPDNTTVLQDLGTIFCRQKEYGKAEKMLRALLELQPTNGKALDALGGVYSQMGDKEKAIEVFKVCLDMNPKRAVTHFCLAHAYGEIGDAKSAEEQLLKTVELQPAFAKAHNNLGAIYRERKEYAKAIASFDRAIAANPEFGKAYKNSGWCYYLMGDFPEAVKRFDKALSLGEKMNDEVMAQLKPYRRP